MSNNKSPGNDNLTKYFHKTFWDEHKEPYIIIIKNYFIKKL